MAYVTKRGSSWFAQIRRKGQKSLSKSFPSKSLADKWAREHEDLISAKRYQDPRIISKITLSSLIDDYRAEMEHKKAFGRTKDWTLSKLKESLGSEPLANLTSDRITKYVNERISSGAGGVTIVIDLAHLATVIKAGKELFNLPITPDHVISARSKLQYAGTRTKSMERDRRPTDGEIDALCKHFDGRPRQKLPMSDIIKFAIASAMRAGEICRIRWDDLNESDRTIKIRDRKDPKKKIGNDQEVPLLGDAFTIAMRQPRTDYRIFPYNEKTISSIFPRACQALGIDDLHFHDLRHEGISRLFEQGYRIEQVALVSGHKNIQMLFRYVQLKAKDLHRD